MGSPARLLHRWHHAADRNGDTGRALFWRRVPLLDGVKNPLQDVVPSHLNVFQLAYVELLLMDLLKFILVVPDELGCPVRFAIVPNAVYAAGRRFELLELLFLVRDLARDALVLVLQRYYLGRI